jgi:ABC-2 type transport system permease protein
MMTLRDRSTLFWGIAFPIGLTVLYGTITAQDQAGGVAAISWLATGVVALTIMASGLVGEAGHFTEMRERGTLQRVQATPLPPLQLVSAAMLVRLLVTLLQVVLVMAVAVVGFGAQTSAGALLPDACWRCSARRCSLRSARRSARSRRRRARPPRSARRCTSR